MLPESAGESLGETGWRRGRRWLVAGFPALRHRNFRLFVVGQGTSLVGFWMQSVAQGWLVYRLSGSPLAVGLVSFCGYVPILCLATAAGVLVDRVSRHRVLVTTQTLLMLLTLVVAVLVGTGRATVPILMVFATGVGLISAFDVPARQAFIVEMVGPQDLPGAIALNSSIFNGARLVGPAIAGSIVGTFGEAPCYFLNTASYLAVLLALVRMRLPPAPPPPPRAPLAAGLWSGLRYVWQHPGLRNLLLLLGVVGGFGLQYQVLMPVFAKDVFAGDAQAYGLLLTAAGAGSVTSALRLASRRYSRPQQRWNLLFGLAAFAAGVLGLAVSDGLGMAIACQALAGFGMIRYTATTNTLLQLLVDDRYRGRVMGLHTVMFLGTAPAGSLLLGALAQRFGARTAAAVAGCTAAAATSWLALRLRRLRTAGAGAER